MFSHHLDQALEPMTLSFDLAILAKGEELENTLGSDQIRLLEELEAIHSRRTGALVAASFDLGIEVGKALGMNRTSLHPPPAGP